MADLYKVMEREQLHSEHAAQCFLDAKRKEKEAAIQLMRPEIGRKYRFHEMIIEIRCFDEHDRTSYNEVGGGGGVFGKNHWHHLIAV
jgi:hypothetical protein